jgi:hypothetical protein
VVAVVAVVPNQPKGALAVNTKAFVPLEPPDIRVLPRNCSVSVFPDVPSGHFAPREAGQNGSVMEQTRIVWFAFGAGRVVRATTGRGLTLLASIFGLTAGVARRFRVLPFLFLFAFGILRDETNNNFISYRG